MGVINAHPFVPSTLSLVMTILETAFSSLPQHHHLFLCIVTALTIYLCACLYVGMFVDLFGNPVWHSSPFGFFLRSSEAIRPQTSRRQQKRNGAGRLQPAL